jgi:hypothetical protein
VAEKWKADERGAKAIGIDKSNHRFSNNKIIFHLF